MKKHKLYINNKISRSYTLDNIYIEHFNWINNLLTVKMFIKNKLDYGIRITCFEK